MSIEEQQQIEIARVLQAPDTVEKIRTTHECEIMNGQGMKVLPRPLRAVLPVVPFAGYLGLISRSPERRPPPRVPETP